MEALVKLLEESNIGDIINIDITVGDKKENIKAKVCKNSDIDYPCYRTCPFYGICDIIPCVAGERTDNKAVCFISI